MYTKWTSHINDPSEKVNFENQIISAKPVLERLLQLVREDQEAASRVEMSVKQFENPNWAYRQAYMNGGRASYEAIAKLIDLDQQNIQKETNDRQFTR